MAGEGYLGERRLKLAEMETPVRRIILTTYAVLLGLAVGVVVREQLPGYEIQTFGGYFILSSIVLIASVTAGVGLALLLTGAAHAKTRWRYLLLAVIFVDFATSVIAGPAAFPNEATTGLHLAIMAMPLVFIAAFAVVAAFRRRLRALTMLGLYAALILTFMAAVFVLSQVTRTPYDATALLLIMGFAMFALAPALLVVGFELAEIGSEGAAAALRHAPVGRLKTPILGASLVVVGVAIAVAVHMGLGLSVSEGLGVLAIWCALVAAATGLAGMLIARRPGPSPATRAEIGYLRVLAGAIVIMLSLDASLSLEEQVPGFVNYDASRAFSLRTPDGLTESYRNLPRVLTTTVPTRVEFRTGKRPPTLTVSGISHSFPGFVAAPPKTVNDLVQGGPYLSPMPLVLGPPDRAGWSRGEGQTANKIGLPIRFFVLRWEEVTLDPHTATTWYLVCGGAADKAQSVRSMCEAARRDFSTMPATRSSRDLAMVFSLLFLAAGVGALILAGRRSRRSDTPALDFMAWVLLLTGVRWTGGFIFGGVDVPLDNLKFAAEMVSALVAVAAVAAAALMVWPTPRARRFDLAGARNLSLQALASLVVLSAVFFLYVFAVGSGERSQIIRGVVVILALTWELATAGASLNPTGEHYAFPRSSRVLIFAGYLILVATCVFMFGESRMASGQMVEAFDTEQIVAAGLVTLGGALVISRALRGIPTLRVALPAAPSVASTIPEGTPPPLPVQMAPPPTL